MEAQSLLDLEHHGTRLSFTASLIAGGRTIIITLPSGDKHEIQVPPNLSPLDGFMPSVEGEVLYCLHVDKKESFCDATTGEWLGPTALVERDQHFL